ncbi:hypothetical protein AQPE_4557 [Aquipluma nitroreducens]|uniref:Uncharacterized protein n=1 Tax=Aquipluma nitroreducens TaxID=2010828 RepID=A0A5K7SFV8_9BACT|nr:hypothetical protein AQPE_4557 [Aquipluma nitroreducens]
MVSLLRKQWSICSGIWWSVCPGNGGQFKLESGGQFHRFFQKILKHGKILMIFSGC